MDSDCNKHISADLDEYSASNCDADIDSVTAHSNSNTYTFTTDKYSASNRD